MHERSFHERSFYEREGRTNEEEEEEEESHKVEEGNSSTCACTHTRECKTERTQREGDAEGGSPMRGLRQ